MVKRKLCYVNTKLRETEVKNKKITKFFFFFSLNVISQFKSTQIRVQLLNILGFFFLSSLELALMGKNFLFNGFSGQGKKKHERDNNGYGSRIKMASE